MNTGDGDSASRARQTASDTLVMDNGSVPTRPASYVPAPYEDRGELGVGGMGIVRRAYDPVLHRDMALKVIREDLTHTGDFLARFITEAQITAQLEHPGVVPIHSLGRLPDGRAYFTMKEVRGRTLDEVIAEVHQAKVGSAWLPSPTGWTLRRLVGALHRVSEAVAYAHSRGVIHRDLKPKNIMVGDFGEVLVLDWGIAKILGDHATPHEMQAFPEVIGDTHTSQTGELVGTPAYMSPEQASGDPERIGFPTDVYALGAVLYEILSGRAPYRGSSSQMIVHKVLQEEPPPFQETVNVPPALHALCQRAMARRVEDRFPDAGALAHALSAWLEGADRRAAALKVVASADALLPEVEALKVEAEALRIAAVTRLAEVKPHQEVGEKAEAWALEDLAAQTARTASLRELAYTQTLQSALNLDRELPEAHERLARHYHGLHQEAEALRDPDATARYEALLRAHNCGRYEAYLAGGALLTLVTDPPGAEATLFRYVERQRHLVLEKVAELGPTPLHRMPLQAGSYVLSLRAPGRAPVRYPIYLCREEHWDGMPPGGREPQPVCLPPADALGSDDVLIPAGWFWSGETLSQHQSLPRRRLWADSFVIRRFPVTVGEHLAFLNRLVDAGREDEALLLAPRQRIPRDRDGDTLLLGRESTGHFVLRPDEEGDLWDPAWPMGLLTWPQARAYARAYARETGLPWRLPFELEREKAARGVDGRFYPWGDRYDPTFACGRESRPGRPFPSPVDSFPIDDSPYGVRGLAGGATDWCMDPFEVAGPRVNESRVFTTMEDERADELRTVRGGAFSFFQAGARAARRLGMHPSTSDYMFGFRLARPL